MSKPPPYDTFPFVEYLNGLSAENCADVAYGSKQKFSGPSEEDVVHHLKLLRAFESLRSRIADEKTWQIYVTNAVRRFVVFISCLRHVVKGSANVKIGWEDEEKTWKNSRDSQLVTLVNSMLPPLDVVMVWHAFLLNPRTFYDTFVRMDFVSFAVIPLPLSRISQAIDNLTFEYEPEEKLQVAYLRLVERFSAGNDPNQVFDVQVYDNVAFSVATQSVDVTCAVCRKTVLWNVPYTNDLRTGFADSGFSQISKQNCGCGSPAITHEELRKRQLLADLDSSRPLPGIFRYFSTVMGADLKGFKTLIVDGYIKREAKNATTNAANQALAKTIKDSCKSSVHGPRCSLILRAYLEMNLIHTTVSSTEIPTLEIPIDLVGCVLRQERFWTKMNKIDLLRSPEIVFSIKESITRYERFFSMMASHDHKQMLVPTLDIDLVWHTHQLSLHYYSTACIARKCGVIDHDDKVEKSRIDGCFEITANLYKKKYKQDYVLCMCWYCALVRARSPKVSTLFKKPSESKVNHGSTHISTHYAVEMLTKVAKENNDKVEDKYHRNMNLPWAYSDTEGLYVFSPSKPMNSCQFYGDSLCGTVREQGGNCKGVVGLLCGSVNSSSVQHRGGCGAYSTI